MFCTDGVCDDASRRGPDAKTPGSGAGAVITPSSRVTMRCSLDTFGSPNFSGNGADATRMRRNTHHNDSPHTFSYALHSEPFAPKSDYCVAYFVKGEVHLTPVATVQQLYPAPESKNNVLDDDEEQLLDDAMPGALRVGRRYISTQASQAASGLIMPDRFTREFDRQRSAVVNLDADTAKEVKFHGIATRESAAMLKRLLSSTREPIAALASGVSQSKEAAQNSLFPPEILASGGITGGSDKTSTIIGRFASRWTVADQIGQLMLRCQILPLSAVAKNVVKQSGELGTTMSDAESDVVAVLRTRALYMHGVWINRTSDDFRGAAAALREVVLLHFFQSLHGSIQRIQLNRLISATTHRRTLKDILQSIAELNADEPDPAKRQWRLRGVPETQAEYLERVDAFRTSFAAEAAAQSVAWQKRAPMIMSHLNYLNIALVPPRLALDVATSGGPGSPMGAASPHGFGSPTAGSPLAPPLQSTEMRDQDLAPIRSYIRGLFVEHGVMNKARAKELMLRGRETHFPKATNQMLSAALQSSVQGLTETTWVLSSLCEPNVDKFRPVILRAIVELGKFETVALHKRVDEMLIEAGEYARPEGAAADTHAVSETILKRVIKEVTEFKSGERLWHLKSGNINH